MRLSTYVVSECCQLIQHPLITRFLTKEEKNHLSAKEWRKTADSSL